MFRNKCLIFKYISRLNDYIIIKLNVIIIIIINIITFFMYFLNVIFYFNPKFSKGSIHFLLM